MVGFIFYYAILLIPIYSKYSGFHLMFDSDSMEAAILSRGTLNYSLTATSKGIRKRILCLTFPFFKISRKGKSP